MPEFISDRFVASGGAWIDIATGRTVRILLSAPAGEPAERSWADRCAALSMLRHPLLNPLIDYGVAGGGRVFEAFDTGGPVRASGEQASRLVGHLVRFLRASDVTLTRPVADYAVRPVVAGPAPRGRPLGITLQRTAVFDALIDTLDAVGPAGPCDVTICGAPHSGLTTLRILIARAARLRGFVPIAPQLLSTEAAGSVGPRHVCVLGEDAEIEHPEVGRFLADRAVGGRRHVVLRFARGEPAAGPALRVSAMPYTALCAATYRDAIDGPTAREILDAARESHGCPGAFVRRLGACTYQHESHSPLTARESAPAYAVVPHATAPVAGGRTLGASLRATARAGHLIARGRHAAASRVLGRAVRILAGRGRPVEAAACSLMLGRVARGRGRVDDAIEALESARALDRDGLTGVEAAIELAAVWNDAGRFVEAEAALRAARLSTSARRSDRHDAIATALLADCLRLQNRIDEALLLPLIREPAAAPEAAQCEVYTSTAHVHLAAGNVAAALRAARGAVAAAGSAADAGAGAMANHAMAVVFLAIGDASSARGSVQEGLRFARAGRRPVDLLRLRAVQVAAADRTGTHPNAARRLIGRARGRVPRAVFEEIARRCDSNESNDDLGTTSAGRRVLVDLESFAELCHAAPDDRQAVQRVCESLLQRLRGSSIAIVSAGSHVLATAGREWPGEPAIVHRVLASGTGAPPDSRVEPVQAAEPVRYNAELIAAIACRWSPGSAVDPEAASALLRMGALAAAGNLRGLLDRGVVTEISPLTRDIVGDSDVARQLIEAIARAARAPFPVLIEGESGSGKELVARAIHRLSPRRERRFCPLNCAALSDELIEAELFGHARGAFTGAVGERMGLFEEADGGTLFLDEIGELSARAQAKLLRVLQDGEVRRVGENVPRRVDVRVVAATNRRLAEEAAAGRFRPDLRFRLDVVRIDVPPLRDRPGDVAVLARHFWSEAAARVDSRATLSPEVLAALARHDWPGNVRELQNVMAWMAVHAPRRGRVGTAALPAHIARAATTLGPCTFDAARQEFERRFVRAALATANGRRASAAAALGVSRQGLAKMMRRLGLEADGKRA